MKTNPIQFKNIKKGDYFAIRSGIFFFVQEVRPEELIVVAINGAEDNPESIQWDERLFEDSVCEVIQGRTASLLAAHQKTLPVNERNSHLKCKQCGKKIHKHRARNGFCMCPGDRCYEKYIRSCRDRHLPTTRTLVSP